MSPRIRQISDAVVLAASSRVLQRLGPALTLADIATEAGIAPATLIQRYGSKRGLLLRLAEKENGFAERFSAARALHVSRCEALMAALEQCAASLPEKEAEVATLVGFLHGELHDEEFARAAATRWQALDREIRNLLDEAAAWGELRAPSVASLARVLQAVYWGALLTWAVAGEGSVAAQVGREVEFALVPHRLS